MSKYAEDFGFENRSFFGDTNLPFKHRIDFMKMSEQAIASLTVNLGDKRGHSPAQKGASDRVTLSVLARVLAT
jgi:hypothetical protein